MPGRGQEEGWTLRAAGLLIIEAGRGRTTEVPGIISCFLRVLEEQAQRSIAIKARIGRCVVWDEREGRLAAARDFRAMVMLIRVTPVL